LAKEEMLKEEISCSGTDVISGYRVIIRRDGKNSSEKRKNLLYYNKGKSFGV